METTGLTLRGYAELTDKFLQAWDDKEGTITDEDVKSFVEGLEECTRPLAVKVDHWISFLGYLSSCVALLKAKREKFTRAIKAVENGIERKRQYIENCIREYPGVEYRGDLGKIRLQKPARPGVEIRFPTKTKSFSDIVFEEIFEDVPGIQHYCEQVTFWRLNKDKIRDALTSGEKLQWATLNDKEVLYVPSLKGNEDAKPV